MGLSRVITKTARRGLNCSFGPFYARGGGAPGLLALLDDVEQKGEVADGVVHVGGAAAPLPPPVLLCVLQHARLLEQPHHLRARVRTPTPVSSRTRARATRRLLPMRSLNLKP
eukprot:883329-Prorocentrum_minimum.AAC.2